MSAMSNGSYAEHAPKPRSPTTPEIASASVADTLAWLAVNPDSGLTHAKIVVRRTNTATIKSH